MKLNYIKKCILYNKYLQQQLHKNTKKNRNNLPDVNRTFNSRHFGLSEQQKHRLN